MRQPGGTASRNLLSIVDRIQPTAQILLETELRHGSQILENLVEQGGLRIVWASRSNAWKRDWRH
ncbi:MAG: hypothetical protein JSS58_10505 [Proteobacteria bacterium]|nr:hypothetical protein [Pseudomonadota bacterium]